MLKGVLEDSMFVNDRLSCPGCRLNGGERMSMQVEDMCVCVGVDERDTVLAAKLHLDLARLAHASHDQLACTTKT